ncbi:hypothetical protein AB0N14_23290 [Streptomyces sp. NPDC051104]|uniref:hypothetical protein n=1 Tax=Streptomyces sp. NPDC051104 TaxID=3155044 RepID=UPI0034138184
MEMTPVDSEPARSGPAFTEPAYRRVRAAQGCSAPVGDATAWDLFRMAFASVSPPGATRPPAAGSGCRRP